MKSNIARKVALAAIVTIIGTTIAKAEGSVSAIGVNGVEAGQIAEAQIGEVFEISRINGGIGGVAVIPASIQIRTIEVIAQTIAGNVGLDVEIRGKIGEKIDDGNIVGAYQSIYTAGAVATSVAGAVGIN